MRIKWRRRSGDAETGCIYTAEVRRSDNRNTTPLEPETRQPTVVPRRKKLTIAHLGTVSLAVRGVPLGLSVARFWDRALLQLRMLDLDPAVEEDLIRRTIGEMPEGRARVALGRELPAARARAGIADERVSRRELAWRRGRVPAFARRSA